MMRPTPQSPGEHNNNNNNVTHAIVYACVGVSCNVIKLQYYRRHSTCMEAHTTIFIYAWHNYDTGRLRSENTIVLRK